MLQTLLHASILHASPGLRPARPQGKPSLAGGPIAGQRQHANPALDQHTLDQQALDLEDPWSRQKIFCAMERQRAPWPNATIPAATRCLTQGTLRMCSPVGRPTVPFEVMRGAHCTAAVLDHLVEQFGNESVQLLGSRSAETKGAVAETTETGRPELGLDHAHDQAHRSPRKEREGGSPLGGRTRVACLGDSITRGDALHEPPYGTHPPYSFSERMYARGNYPATLQSLLGSRWHVANFGHSGWRSSNLASFYKEQVSRGWQQLACYGPKLVLVMVGTNDVLLNKAPLNESQFAPAFHHALASTVASLLALPSQPHVVLLDPPPIGSAAAMHKGHILNELIPALLADAAQGLPRVRHLSGRVLWGGCPEEQHACCLMHETDPVHLNANSSEALARHLADWITRPRF